MNSANWMAAILVAVASLLASNACHAADILFSEAASKCVKYHADPTQTLSAADATGWRGLTNTTGMIVNPHVRLKDYGGVQLYMKVEASQRSGETVRTCSVASISNLSWADLLQAAQSYFSVPPSQDQRVETDPALQMDLPAQVVQWIYVERDGHRSYLRGDQLKHVEELAGNGTAHALSLFHSLAHDPTNNSLAVMYKEVTKTVAP